MDVKQASELLGTSKPNQIAPNSPAAEALKSVGISATPDSKSLITAQERLLTAMEESQKAAGHSGALLRAGDLGEAAARLTGELPQDELRKILADTSDGKWRFAQGANGKIKAVEGGTLNSVLEGPSMTRMDIANRVASTYDRNIGMSVLEGTLSEAKSVALSQAGYGDKHVKAAWEAGEHGAVSGAANEAVAAAKAEGTLVAETTSTQEFQKLLQSGLGKSQAGHADVRLMAATAGALGVASMGAKAAFTHLAPAGMESAMQAERADEISTQAERNLAKGRLTQAQHDIIQEYTTQHAVAVSATSLIPDPTGLSTDVVANRGDARLVEELTKAGLSETQAKQYQLGSLTGSLQEAGNLVENHYANLQAVRQGMAEKGQVPLSLALNIPPEQLQVLGEYSSRLGDKMIQREVSRNSDFESLAHLPAEQIGQLSRLAAAGIDPKVQVHDGEITLASQRPQHLSENPKQAFTEAATYIFQSGDHQYHAPKNSPVEVQASVAAFGKLYEHLTKDNGVSDQDVKVLAMSMQNITKGLDNHQVQGLVAQYTQEQAPQHSHEPELQR